MMAKKRELLLCSCLLLNALTTASGCFKRLGDNNEMVTFQCLPNGDSDVAWRLNSMVLPDNNNEKYQTSLGYLTVNKIVHSDEGNYTCVSGQQTYPAGCLLVYGKAYFDNNHRNIKVSADGTITFNFTLSFTQSGPSMNKQTVSKYTLKKDDNSLVTCNPVCDTDPHQWWTVEQMENGRIFVLHEAKSTDRGNYRAEIELTNPKDNSLNDLTRTYHVTSPECGPYPGIENGTVSTLESTVFINGAQANYSCSEGCELQGSRSLRCLIIDINLQQTTQWVNETGQEDTPSCSCPTTASKPTPTFTASSGSSQSSSTHQDLSSRVKISSTGTGTSSVSIRSSGDYPSEGQTAIPVIVAVCVSLLVFIIVGVAIVVGVMVVFKRRRRDKKKVPEPEVETYHGCAEDDSNTDSYQSVSQ